VCCTLFCVAGALRGGRHPHKIVSLFEPRTEIIRKGKASKPNEVGNMVKVQEAENLIITHYEVFAERRNLAACSYSKKWAIFFAPSSV
jgi:hypothetical protein